MITARVEEIRRMIIDNHDGSVEDIKICLGSYDKDSVMDPKKTLKDYGICTDGDFNIIYDFVPFSHPLLTSTMLSKAEETAMKEEEDRKKAEIEARNQRNKAKFGD